MAIVMGQEAGAGQVRRDNRCFVCGQDNPHGLRLAFAYPEPGRAETDLVIPDRFSGWERLTHGGLLATLLDEAMAHACISREGNAVTVEITVRFLKPVEVGRRVRVCGRVGLVKGRVVETEGEILNPQGQVVARGQARFLLM
jgi:uncharacterized protein (TIGR00369 family)